MSWTDRIRSWLGEPEAKAAVDDGIGYVVSTTPTVAWGDLSYDRMAREGYERNAAVFQCIQRLAIGYNEPPPIVRDAKGELVPTSPLQRLLNRPNPLMTHSELQNVIVHYKSIGGNCYLHIVRNGRGVPLELRPYNSAQMRPVPGKYVWVDHYEYIGNNRGEPVKIPVEDIIHLKWPSIDPDRPWLALAPLMAVAREVDTDSEMTRYLFALLKNDAAPRGVIGLPPGERLSPTQADKLRAQIHQRHGGDNVGGVVLLEQGATYSRVSLNMQELAFEALRRVPESRIAGAFGVPAILAGLYVGLEKATYANYGEAREQLTQDTYVPMWKSDAAELTAGLAPSFGDYTVEYDLSHVAALQEDETAKYQRALDAFDRNLTTKNEARQYIGLVPVGNIIATDPGDVFADGTVPGEQPRTTVIDVTPVPAQLTDDAKRRREAKARKDTAAQRIEKRMQRTVSAYMDEQGKAVLKAVQGAD